MDSIQKLRAFAASAELGSFSAAARKLYTTPSVIMKRVNELEQDFRVQLFTRTTRRVHPTEEGQVYLRQAQEVLQRFQDMQEGRISAPDALEGGIRVRSLGLATQGQLGQLFLRFQTEHPRVHLNVTLSDEKTNPIEDHTDVAIGIFPISYEGVSETLMHPYPRVTCASPAYLERHGVPRAPHELTQHRCIAFLWAGPVWEFNSSKGSIGVDVQPIMTTNSPIYLRQLALAGHGIVQLSRAALGDCLLDGSLVEILADYPLEQPWLKIIAPETRLSIYRVQHFCNYIKTNWTTVNPSAAVLRPAHSHL